VNDQVRKPPKAGFTELNWLCQRNPGFLPEDLPTKLSKIHHNVESDRRYRTVPLNKPLTSLNAKKTTITAKDQTNLKMGSFLTFLQI
jgi:hypothetical protein